MNASLTDVCKTADDMYVTYDTRDAFELVDAAYTGGERHPELLWRLGRACWLMFDNATDKKQRRAYLERGMPLAKEAHEADPTLWKAWHWHGMCQGSLVDFLSAKERISQAYDVKELLDKAAALAPTAPSTVHDVQHVALVQHALGKWCFTITSVGMVERKVASMIFSAPPVSSFEECEAHLKKAAELDPTAIFNNLLLGDLYYSVKQWKEAHGWYTRATETPEVTLKTENTRLRLAEATKKAKSCKGY